MGLLRYPGGRLVIIDGRPVRIRSSIDIIASGFTLRCARSASGNDMRSTGTLDGTWTVPLDACLDQNNVRYRTVFTGTGVTTTRYSSSDGTCSGTVLDSTTDMDFSFELYLLSTPPGPYIDATIQTSGLAVIGFLFHRLQTTLTNAAICALSKPMIITDDATDPGHTTTGGSLTICL